MAEPKSERPGGRRASFLGGIVVGLLCAGLAVGFAGRSTTTVSASRSDGGASIDGGTGGGVDGEQTAGGDPNAPGASDGGPSSDGSGGPTGQGPTGTGPSATGPGATLKGTLTSLGATGKERGVTPTTINLAILLADTGGAAAFGVSGNIGDNKKAHQAYVDEINKAGGINGRKIVTKYITFDPLNYDTLQTACTEATETFESFAVIDLGIFYGPAILCITEQHKTPFITYEGEPDEWYARSKGLFFSLSISKHRMMRIFPKELERQGLLKGHKIGVLGTQFPTDRSAIEGALLPQLKAMGYSYTYYVLSQDYSTLAAQMPVAVQTMQQAGVDRMILLTNLLGNQPFVQQADKRFYRPQYLVADFACGTCDAATTIMPESFDGAIGITTTRVGSERLGLPQPAYEKSCADRYQKQTGEAIPYGYPQDANYSATLICTVMDRWADGVRRAGPNLTRASWSSAMKATGPFEASGLLAASFTPTKLDAPNQIRTVRWSYSYQGSTCRCFLPTDAPRPAGNG